jgi:ferric-dicitrate binding protein FerR (iron transport regulator)
MEKNYESYKAEEFLDDPFFIQWIKDQSPAARVFWDGWIEKNPANLKEMRAAEAQLRAILSAKRVQADTGDAEEVWERIENSLSVEGDSKVRRMPQRWWAAASILLLLASGSYFFFGNHQAKKEVAVVNKHVPVNDVAPGGNKAVLTLADGSVIILDSAQNGTLSKQGNIKIIKLDDGQLAYDKSGLSANSQVLYNTISTPKGGQYQVTLSDGSKVWLNAASSLRFPATFSGKERKVELTGEGYFEVAHNKKMPFHVTVNDLDVEVLGTHFNINAYADESAIKTTLLEGSVKVVKGNETKIIEPGEQASVTTSEDEINVKQQVDLEQVVAWKNEIFQFERADIESVMRQISRWYDIDVDYHGRVSEHFGGTISRDVNISDVLKMLEMTGGVNFKIDGKKVIVMP